MNGCTCGGTAPGYPQHEDYCGKPEPVECELGCLLDEGHDEPRCLTVEDVAEERLKGRDYEAWADL